MMYVQENEETMPGLDFWSAVDVTGKVLICPTAGKKIANGYSYNGNLNTKGLGEIKDPVLVALTADSVATDNIMYGPSDIELRHVNKAIMSFVDGHVEYTDNTLSIAVMSNEALLADTPVYTGATGAAGSPAVMGNFAGTSGGAAANVMQFDGTALTFVGAYSRSMMYTMPATDFVAEGTTTAPTEWWGVSMDLKYTTANTSYNSLNSLPVVIYDGDDKILAMLYVNLAASPYYYGTYSGYGIYLGGTNAMNIWSQTFNTDTAPAHHKVFVKLENTAADGGTNKAGDAAYCKSLYTPTYNLLNQGNTLTFVIDKNGYAAMSFAGKSVSGQLTGRKFDAAPKINFPAGDSGNITITNLSFGGK